MLVSNLLQVLRGWLARPLGWLHRHRVLAWSCLNSFAILLAAFLAATVISMGGSSLAEGRMRQASARSRGAESTEDGGPRRASEQSASRAKRGSATSRAGNGVGKRDYEVQIRAPQPGSAPAPADPPAHGAWEPEATPGLTAQGEEGDEEMGPLPGSPASEE